MHLCSFIKNELTWCYKPNNYIRPEVNVPHLSLHICYVIITNEIVQSVISYILHGLKTYTHSLKRMLRTP